MDRAWALVVVTFASFVVSGAHVQAQAKAATPPATTSHVTADAAPADAAASALHTPAETAAAPAASAPAAAEPAADLAAPDDNAADAAATSAETNADTSAEAVATANAHHQRKSGLELLLQKNRDERADTNRFPPWLLTAGGIAAIAVGVSWGLSRSQGCSQRSCSTSFLPGWIVVGGTGMLVAGVIWLELQGRDIAELDRRRHSLEQELQYLEWNEARNLPLNDGRPTLAWHGTF